MRILFVSHYALPHQGGIEVAIDQLARALTARGHEVAHLASDLEFDPLVQRPYRVIPVDSVNLLESRWGVPVPLFHPRLIGAVLDEIARADVVHAHGFLYPSSAAALLLARFRAPSGPARVLTEHVGRVRYDSPWLNRIEGAGIASLGRAVVRSAEAVVVYNQRVEAELRLLTPSASLRWIENGVDLERFHPPVEGEREKLRRELGWDDRPKVLFVGRLVAKKGVELAMGAAREGRDEFDLIVVGPGSAPTNLPPNVKILGPLPADQVARLYRAADALLLPSRGEGFPLTVQEAVASGLPAFVLDDPGYSKYFASMGAQLIRTPDNPREMAAMISARLRSRPVATVSPVAMGWASAAEQHEEIYREILARRIRLDARRGHP